MHSIDSMNRHTLVGARILGISMHTIHTTRVASTCKSTYSSPGYSLPVRRCGVLNESHGNLHKTRVLYRLKHYDVRVSVQKVSAQ